MQSSFKLDVKQASNVALMRATASKSACLPFSASREPLHTFGALQAKARHVEAGRHRRQGRHGALDWMNQEERPLLVLNTVEWHHRGAVRAD